MIQEIEKILKKHLLECLPEHSFKDVMLYATLPAGKLFRPQLIWALAQDLGDISNDHKYFASSVEIHHAYTLVHDDLPAMDDDEYRRGKPSTHIKFNEWKAILAGDALLNASFGLLGKIQTNLPELICTYSEYTGAKGLILGQVLDLEKNERNFNDIVKIHSLKTSRLIQLSLIGTNIICHSPLNKELLNQAGLSLGILFQLLDDLTELSDELGEHEKQVNPFLNFDQTVVINEITENLTKLHNILIENSLSNLSNVIYSYQEVMRNKIYKGKKQILKYIPEIESIFTVI